MRLKDKSNIPMLISPMEGMDVADIEVQFCWSAVADGFGYTYFYRSKLNYKGG